MSDWDATHSTVKAAQNGMDQEQPESPISLRPETSGPERTGFRNPAEHMVHRILRSMYAVGIFDHPLTSKPIDASAGAAVAQEVEEQGAVLLRNRACCRWTTRS